MSGKRWAIIAGCTALAGVLGARAADASLFLAAPFFVGAAFALYQAVYKGWPL
jgi:hypothetical protein